MRRLMIVGALLVACGRGQQQASREEVLEVRALFAEDQLAQAALAKEQQAAQEKRNALIAKIDEIFARTKRDKSKWNMDLKTGAFTPIAPAPPAKDAGKK